MTCIIKYWKKNGVTRIIFVDDCLLRQLFCQLDVFMMMVTSIDKCSLTDEQHQITALHINIIVQFL